MNSALREARIPLLDYLGLDEIETVCTKIRCDTPRLPHLVASMRPQMDTRGPYPHMHTAQAHQSAMDDIADRYRAARGLIRASFKGPVIFCLVSHRGVPRSWPRRRIGEQFTCRPDNSNLVKLVEDALNKIAYHDDAQIVAEIPLKAPRLGDFDWYEIEITYCEARHEKRLPL